MEGENASAFEEDAVGASRRKGAQRLLADLRDPLQQCIGEDQTSGCHLLLLAG